MSETPTSGHLGDPDQFIRTKVFTSNLLVTEGSDDMMNMIAAEMTAALAKLPALPKGYSPPTLRVSWVSAISSYGDISAFRIIATAEKP